jgi:hypothetical protein
MGSRPLVCALLTLALSGCTVTRVGAEDGPPRVQSRGLLDGHAAVGIRDEDDFLRLRLLDGASDGSLGEVVLWKLFRLEVGALGASVGIGPFDFALGTLFYEPEVPEMGADSSPEGDETPPGGELDERCEICAEAAQHDEPAGPLP